VAKKPENERPSAVKDNQKEAYLSAKRIALREGRSITVYYSNGQKKVIVPKDTEEDDCFITTACVEYFGLSDNSSELTTLRHFRDSYMKSKPELLPLIEIYYLVAPDIVSAINYSPKKVEIYKGIFMKVKDACSLIENGQSEEAVNLYSSIIQDCIEKYLSECQ
jgi:hypothetical protein